MQEIYKSSLLLVHSLTKLCGVCYKYNESPDDDSGEKIIEVVDNCERKFLKVKEEIVKMVENAESEKQKNVSVIETESGFLIKE